MGFTTLLGKALIIASIIFEAYLFFVDKQAINTFDKQLAHALSTCDCLTPQIQKLVKQYLRLVLAGLLASSALLLIKWWGFKLPPLLGLSLLVWVEHHDVFRRVPTPAILQNTALWHSFGVIGAIIYLLGSEWGSSSEKGASEKKESQKSKVQEIKSSAPVNQRNSREKKKN